jgi:hypothetical protein
MNLAVCSIPIVDVPEFNERYEEFCDAYDVNNSPFQSIETKARFYTAHLRIQKAELTTKACNHIARIVTERGIR